MVRICYKVREHCHYTGKYRGAACNICSLLYKIKKEIFIVFHNGTNYDYHFVIKLQAEEIKGQFKCLQENAEKYIAFLVSIEKEIKKTTKMEKKFTKTISYK